MDGEESQPWFWDQDYERAMATGEVFALTPKQRYEVRRIILETLEEV